MSVITAKLGIALAQVAGVFSMNNEGTNVGIVGHIGQVMGDFLEGELDKKYRPVLNRQQRRAAFAQKCSRKHLRKKPSRLTRRGLHCNSKRNESIFMGQCKLLGLLARADNTINTGAAGLVRLANK